MDFFCILLLEQADMISGEAVCAIAGNSVGNTCVNQRCRIDYCFGENYFFMGFCSLAVEDTPTWAEKVQMISTFACNSSTVDSGWISCRVVQRKGNTAVEKGVERTV